MRRVTEAVNNAMPVQWSAHHTLHASTRGDERTSHGCLACGVSGAGNGVSRRLSRNHGLGHGLQKVVPARIWTRTVRCLLICMHFSDERELHTGERSRAEAWASELSSMHLTRSQDV